MDNSNKPANAPTENTVSQEAPSVTPVSSVQQQPAPNHRNRLHVILVAVIVLALLTLIPVAYMLGRNQSVIDAVENINLGTNSTSELRTAEEVEEPTVEVSDVYEGWSTYENEVYGYSFRYPSGWQVEREVIQSKADWVGINPVNQANSVGPDVLAIHTYFDGTGCPVTKTKEFTVGEYTVQGTSCVDAELYRIPMKHSQTVGAASDVVLAAIPQNMVGIQVDMSRGEDKNIQLILDSITGLIPLS